MLQGNDRIREILLTCERALLQVIGEAANAGDYAAIDRAREVAAAIRSVVDRFGKRENDHQQPAVASSTPPKRAVLKTKGYPRFAVRDGYVFKTGWSKSRKREYEHKAPRAVFDRAVEAMAKLARSGSGPFAVERIMELLSQQTDDPPPIYQVYVVLALLRHNGVIKQTGRDGYQFEQSVADEARSTMNRIAADASTLGT